MRALIVLITTLLCGCGVTPCALETECGCLTRAECRPVTESCFCPTQCDGRVCVCGGGAFLRCEDAAR